MNALTGEEARALRDRIKGAPHSETSYAFVTAMAKLTSAVRGWEGIRLPEVCADCEQEPCACSAIDAWRAA